MGKGNGGSRNYGKKPTFSKRKGEYRLLMSSGEYVDGYISKTGGFYVIHKEHREINHKNGDYSDVAAKKLAKKGYKVYLESERTYLRGESVADGKVYTRKADFKTITKTGNNTIKGDLEKASKQDAEVVVLYQRTRNMTREYVESQIDLFRKKSPLKARKKIKEVIVVGLSGNIHRHKI